MADKPEEYQAIIQMPATMVLRQEAQFLIQKQDTSFVLFIQTHLEHSVAKSTLEIAQKWHEMKAAHPRSWSRQ